MKRILLSIIISAFIFQVNAQIDRTKAPAAGPAPEVRIGDYQSFKLDNGLTVFVIENHKVPMVTYSLALDLDPILEGDKAGYVSMAGDLLRAGTTNRTKDQIDEAVDFIGASLSTSSKGIYGRSLTKYSEKLLDIMSDILYNSTFPESELEKNRKQQLTGLQSQKTEPRAIAANVSGVLLYGKDHPYGEVVSEETLKNITVNDCKNYYKTYFHPNVAYLVMVGDITLKEAKKQANKYFSDWKPGDIPKHKYDFPKGYDSPKVVVANKDGAKQSVIEVTYTVNLKPGEKDVMPAGVMNEILGGGGFSSRLFQNLREDKGYTYGAYSSLRSNKLAGRFTATASVRNAVTDSALVEMLKEMNKIRDEKVPEEDLNITKNIIAGNFARSLENPQTIARFALNTAIYDLPADYYKTYLQRLAAVNADDVQAMAKKYILPEHAVILAVGDVSQIKDKMKHLSPTGEVDQYDFYGNEVKESAVPAGLTVEQVIDNYIKARGGEENILKIKNVKSEATASIQGMTLNITSYKEVPNKICVETYMNGNLLSKQICDGENAKVVSMQGEQKLQGKMLDQMKYQAYLFPELEYSKEGYKTEMTGMEDVDGKPAYRVKVTNPAGDTQTLSFDKESGLMVKEVTPTPQGSSTTFVKEYKEVNGVKFPVKVTQSVGPQMIDVNVEKIEVNTDIEESKFEI